MVIEATRYFIKKMNGRVILSIENNSIGKSIVEAVQITDLVYYLYYDPSKLSPDGKEIKEYGINTNGKTKPLMTSLAFDWINKYPENIRSEDFINQLHSLERNNAGEISSSNYTDMFMACCFCAYTRKMKELEILPHLTFNAKDLQEREVKFINTFIEMSNPKEYAAQKNIEEKNILNNVDEEENIINYKKDDDSPLPFFFNV